MRYLLSLFLALNLTHGAQTYVVAVGVSTYPDKALPKLRFAVQDAEAFADVYRDAGVPDDNIVVLTSDAWDLTQQPTQSNILRSLEHARQRVQASDTVIFYFAGHGVQKSDDAYLLTLDTKREALARTGLPVRLLEGIRRGFPTRQVLFVLDACRNNPDADALTPFHGDVPPDLAELAACQPGQKAWEMSAKQHGAFTYYLIQGLSGAARGDDGAVHLRDLAGYVSREVSSWAVRAHHDQTPMLSMASPVADFEVLPRPAFQPVIYLDTP